MKDFFYSSKTLFNILVKEKVPPKHPQQKKKQNKKQTKKKKRRTELFAGYYTYLYSTLYCTYLNKQKNFLSVKLPKLRKEKEDQPSLVFS